MNGFEELGQAVHDTILQEDKREHTEDYFRQYGYQ